MAEPSPPGKRPPSLPRIATVTLNAAIDQTLHLPGFTLDAVNRVERMQTDAGGKGINVASFLAQCGHGVAVSGLLGRENERLFARHFARLGLVDACIRVEGATRINLKLVDSAAGQFTDINLPGIWATLADLHAVYRRLEPIVAEGLDWLVLSGSLPGGLEADTYVEMIRWAKARGCRVVLDSSGPALHQVLGGGCGPDILKPNIAELRDALGQPLADRSAAARAARRLVGEGAGLVVVSMGSEGAIFCDGAMTLHAAAAPRRVAGTVGAGDAMVAGLVHAATRRLSLSATARLATAFSLGTLGEVGTRLPPLESLENQAQSVQVCELEG